MKKTLMVLLAVLALATAPATSALVPAGLVIQQRLSSLTNRTPPPSRCTSSERVRNITVTAAAIYVGARWP